MTNKATRATIKLGDIDLDVFQLPDGEYRLSLTQSATALGFDKRRGSDFLGLEVVQNLTTYALQGSGFIAEDTNQKIKALTMDAFKSVVMYYALKGNLLAQAILEACLVEALERRADAAFGVVRDEEERNDRMAARVKGKVARRSLTDVIKAYVESRDVSDNYKKFIFSNCSDHLNKIILGAKAKQAKEFYHIPESSLLRNHIPVDALRELELTEEMAARLIEERDMEPLEAVKQACVVCFTRSVGLGE
jgi:hypothetical protein